MRYLSADQVRASAPSIEKQIALAEWGLRATAVDDAEVPAKIGVHPRPDSVIHAMPAYLRSADLAGMKWISTYPANRSTSRSAIDAIIVLNDAGSGEITDIVDGNVITALRTAAVSGAALKALAPPNPSRAAIVGAGVQGRSHLDVLAHLFPNAEIAVFDRHEDRAEALAAASGGRAGGGRGTTIPTATLRQAVSGAAVVVTAGALDSGTQMLPIEWLEPEVLVVAIDHDTHVSAQLARSASAFAVDDRSRYQMYLDEGVFRGFPQPDFTLGELLVRELGHGALGRGRVLVCPLGIGLMDVIFADAVRRRAIELGVGRELPR